MSLAATTSIDRGAPGTARTVAATPARRTSTQPTTTRTGIASPPAVRKPPSTPATNRTTTTTRPRPLASSTSRNAGAGAGVVPSTLLDKKRLSTIPASPHVKIDLEDSGDNKENVESDVEKKSSAEAPQPNRPALGSRKSTRSVLIEQQIREFELVNTMLMQAMASDGTDDQEQQEVNETAAASIAKLKADLIKVRQFERENGRLPTEGELDGVGSLATETISEQAEEGSSSTVDFKAQLKASQAEIDALQSELDALKTKLETSTKTAADNDLQTEEAAEAVRKEHSTRIDELVALHDQKYNQLSDDHQKEVESLSATQAIQLDALKDQLSQKLNNERETIETLQTELEETRSTSVKQQAEHRAEVEKMRLELEAQNAANASPSPSSSPDHAQELASAQQKLEAAQSRHLAAKDNAKSKIAKIQEDAEARVSALEAQHREELELLKRDQEHAQTELSSKVAELDAIAAELDSKTSQVATQDQEHVKINGEVARQAQVIESLKSQISAFQQTKKEESDAQAVTISQLEADLANLKQRQLDEAESASSSLALAEKAHVEKLATIEKQVKTAQLELDDASAKHSNELTAAAEKSQAKMTAIIQELESSKASSNDQLQAAQAQLEEASETAKAAEKQHQAALQGLQSQLELGNAKFEDLSTRYDSILEENESRASISKAEMATLKDSHAEQLQKLNQQLQSSTNDLVSLKEKHNSEIKTLEQQVQSTLKDLDILDAGHVEELVRARQEAAETHQKEQEDAEIAHVKRVRELEAQLNDASSQEATYLQSAEDYKRQAALDHESTISALKASHAEILKTLASDLTIVKETVEAEKAAHKSSLERFEEEAAARHEVAIESLKSSHAKEIQEIGEKSSAVHQQALDDLRTSLAEERKVLESQHQSLQSDMESTRFQLQTLKGILQDVEAEGQEKITEFETRIEKLDSDLSKSVVKLAEKSSQVWDLQSQHEQALANAQKTFDENSKAELEMLRSSHEETLAQLRSTLEDQHSTSTSQLQQQHAEALKALGEEHKLQLTDLQQQIKEEHGNQLDEVMKTLESQWKSQVDQLEESNAEASGRLARQTKEHEDALANAESQHGATLAQLKLELQQAQDALETSNDTSEIDAVKSQLSEALDKANAIEENHATAMSAIAKEHALELDSIREQVKAAKATADLRKDPTEFEVLNQKYVEAQKALDELQKQQDQSLRDNKADFDAKYEKVLLELNEAKQTAQNGTDSSEVDALKTGFDEAKKQLAVLQGELDGALLEIETQRGMADFAAKEAEQYKRQTEAISLASPKSSRKSRSPRRKSMNPISPTSAKGGLNSSRWATTSEDSTSTSTGLRGGGDEEVLDENTPSKTRANVQGQLAGIQEQVKQIQELDNDMLLDNQKMASFLSKVGDRTETLDAVHVDEEV